MPNKIKQNPLIYTEKRVIPEGKEVGSWVKDVKGVNCMVKDDN